MTTTATFISVFKCGQSYVPSACMAYIYIYIYMCVCVCVCVFMRVCMSVFIYHYRMVRLSYFILTYFIISLFSNVSTRCAIFKTACRMTCVNCVDTLPHGSHMSYLFNSSSMLITDQNQEEELMQRREQKRFETSKSGKTC